jgi:lysozyme
MIVSASGYNMLRSEEGLASLAPDRTVIGKNSTPAGTTIFAYKDTKSIWTIGWGSTILADGSKVTQSTTMTKSQADSLLEVMVSNSFAKDVKRFLGVPVTQAMFDTLVCMAYNIGSVGLRNTDFWRELNRGNYKAAADLIPSTKTNNGTLTARRTREKSHFLSDGIPQNSKVDK